MSRPLIVHLITDLEVGGTELMLTRLLPRLQNSYEIVCCSIFPIGPVGAILQEKGIVVHSLNLRFKWNPLVAWRLYKFLHQVKPAILITHLIHSDLLGRLVGPLAGIRAIICSQQGSLLQWEFLRSVDRLTTKLVSQYIVQTAVAQQELQQKLHLPSSRFTVIPNAVEPVKAAHDRTTTRHRLHLPLEALVIVCVARLRRKKGHEYLLAAFDRLYQQFPSLQLLLVGDGERETELQQLAASLAARPTIRFLGRRDDVADILVASDIFVLPTLAEGMSNAILEAMSVGRACVVTDIPANQALITHQQTGLLCQAGDSDSLERALAQLITNPALREQLGQAAQSLVHTSFAPETVAQSWKNLITRLLAAV